MRADRADHDRVSVGRRLRDRVGAGVSSGTRLVVDDDRLAPVGGHALADETRQDVRRAAGSDGDDDVDRPGGKARGGGLGRRPREGDESRRGQYRKSESIVNPQ